MSKADQDQAGGFSKSEKAMLVRAAMVGLVASVATLWLGDVFAADGPSLLNLEVILACLFSFIAAVLLSVMGESVIEDIVKLVMFIVLWWFTRKYEMFDLVTLGLLIGGVAAFLGNRMPGKS